jgi:site-specific DNA-methyltransferase (adenine-specific)
MPDCSVDAVVTDPPYGLSFMGKKWDYDVPSVEVWAECLRVLKPGGHLLAFAGTRTQHRMAVRIEDAGFEIRDMIAWVYGSGFPKSLDVSKAIDKAAGVEREVVGFNENWRTSKSEIACPQQENQATITAPATDAAKQWQGWGTALKPALEPITVARKPLVGTVAENVLQHGTGAINVDGGRVEGGRWPANFIHDGSEEATDLLKDSARFFYCAKASKADRDAGCEGLELKVGGGMQGRNDGSMGSITMSRNHHPTVKPTDLMRYLCRLVTPPNGVVLDPFMGSGSTGKAAALEGFGFIGIERDAEYVAIAQARINHVTND